MVVADRNDTSLGPACHEKADDQNEGRRHNTAENLCEELQRYKVGESLAVVNFGLHDAV